MCQILNALLYQIYTLHDISLVPSRYIEFVDRDKTIDYEQIMKDTASTVENLLKQQKQNQKALQKAFKELGYEL